MGRDGEATDPAHALGEHGELVVLGTEAPVDPGARRQAQREPVPGAGGDLLAGDDQEVVGDVPAPGELGGGGVVLGGADEVQAGLAGQRQQRALGVAAVGVDGVEVAVAAVPPGPGALHASRGGLRTEALRLPTEVQRHRHLVVDARRHYREWAEHDVPGAGGDQPGEVARSSPAATDAEPVPRPAGPAAEPARVAEVVPAGVEDPDVDHVGAEAQAGVGLLVGVGHLDLAHPAGHLDRQVVPVRRAHAGEGASERLGAALPGRRRLEARHGRGRHDPGGAGQEAATGQGTGAHAVPNEAARDSGRPGHPPYPCGLS